MTKTVKISQCPGLIDFLASQQALTMAVPIDTDGTVHAAAMRYWNSVDPFRFYIITERDTEKCNLLKSNSSIGCAVVVGTEKGTPFAIQMRGKIGEISVSENQSIIDSYYEKTNNKYDDINDPKNCLLEFIPDYAKYTDYSIGYYRIFIDLSDN